MKEYPILFSGPMVRAILDGRKTQTRRVVKPQPKHAIIRAVQERPGEFCKFYDADCIDPGVLIECPYGQPGDQLWVRETWKTYSALDEFRPCRILPGPALLYLADRGSTVLRPDVEPWGKSRPSIFMPRSACRILLEIVSVRVERLNEISEADALAEGTTMPDSVLLDDSIHGSEAWALSYKVLWDSINAKRGFGWEVNPWVWVIEFKRITP